MIPGINDYLNHHFLEMKESYDYGFFMVRNVIIIHINFLIEQYDLFKSGELNFFELLNNYYNKMAWLRTKRKHSPSDSKIVT